MERYDMPESGPGLCGCDREVFNRVWRRVMPVDTYGSPVQLIGEEEGDARGSIVDSSGHGPDPWLPEPPVQPLPPAIPSPPTPSVPTTPAVSCLGPASAVYGAQLQEFIAHELADCRCYMALSRRTSGNPRQVLIGIAQDEKRHAKRLSTAYFLISGVEYWPDKPTAPVAATGPMPACIRQRFVAEQKGELAFRTAAERTCDPCLKELYLELAGDENNHSWLLRGLLERM